MLVSRAFRAVFPRAARRAALLAVAAALVTTACKLPAPGSSTPRDAGGGRAAQRVGFATGGLLPWETDALLAQDFDAMQATGARWVGIELNWAAVQPNGPGLFNWGPTDRLARAARSRGMQVMGSLNYTPGWAARPGCSGGIFCAPSTDGTAAYKTFAQAAALRYGANSSSSDPLIRGSIEAWQIWNEPNNAQFWRPRPNLDEYVALLRQGYAGIKAADAGATVITGGTAPEPDAGSNISPVTWIKGLYSRGAKDAFDAVGHHPYAFGPGVSPLDDAPWNAFKQTEYLYGVMLAYNDGGKKIWATEAGAPTGTEGWCGMSEAAQAQSLLDYMNGWNNAYKAFTGPIMFRQVRDEGTNVASCEQMFGMLRHDYSQKPSYAAFKAALTAG